MRNSFDKKRGRNFLYPYQWNLQTSQPKGNKPPPEQPPEDQPFSTSPPVSDLPGKFSYQARIRKRAVRRSTSIETSFSFDSFSVFFPTEVKSEDDPMAEHAKTNFGNFGWARANRVNGTWNRLKSHVRRWNNLRHENCPVTRRDPEKIRHET